jgi:hypothetical protein
MKRLMNIAEGVYEEGEERVLSTDKAKLMSMCSLRDALDREARSLVNVFELDPDNKTSEGGQKKVKREWAI